MSALAGAITSADFSIPKAQAAGVAYLATVPILDHVASTTSNNTGIDNLCPGNPTCATGSPDGFAVNSGNIDFVSTDANSSAFVIEQSRPRAARSVPVSRQAPARAAARSARPVPCTRTSSRTSST